MRIQTQRDFLEELQSNVQNKLDLDSLRGRRLAAILGDTPSRYAKSPVLWNAGFKALGLEATFVPLDVLPEKLASVVDLLRQADEVLGFSVTVPYKKAILALLDELDLLARQIGAVNTVARRSDGRLVGYNTDASGALRALTEPILPGVEPLVSSWKGLRILLIGSGGAAQAVACAVWEKQEGGALTLTNRTFDSAQQLAQRLKEIRPGRVQAVEESQMDRVISDVDLVINASTKGQAGIRPLPDGKITCLEPYSALAPAQPAALPASLGESPTRFQQEWFRESADGIHGNFQQSLKTIAHLPASAGCFDLIYTPLETVFLRQARLSGHHSMNGKGMNIAQAAEAFFHKVCKGFLEEKGHRSATHEQQLIEAMLKVWDNPGFSDGKSDPLAQMEQTKSLVARHDLPAGHSLRREDLTEKPPLMGITARHLEFLVGKQILYDIKEGEPITFGILSL